MSHSINKALAWNIAQAKGLQEVLRTNLGPTGTMKMLVSGGGDIKITKDGARLLSEMQIQLPTAQFISRSAAAIDDQYGDGTSSVCILNAEILKGAERYLLEGVHPRILVDGIKEGCQRALKYIDHMAIDITPTNGLLEGVVHSSLVTKVPPALAENMTKITTEAVNIIRKNQDVEAGEKKPLDLHMIEIMHMQHKLATETSLVRGLVLDHGGRHPDMPKELFKCYILICNVSLEYEKSEINAGYAYSTPEQREKMAAAERAPIDKCIRQIIELKRSVCTNGEGFVVINQKGIDPLSLDSLAKENILGLRRAKKRNMERLALACGGVSVNSTEELTPDVLGYAGHVWEVELGEDKYTFVEECKDPRSCTILVKGCNTHVIQQVKDAFRDSLRAAKNALEDDAGRVVPGGGAVEVAASVYLSDIAKGITPAYAGAELAQEPTQLKNTAGIQLLADALLVIPKLLAQNSGFDALETVVRLSQEHRQGHIYGLDTATGLAIPAEDHGIVDNVCVKKQILSSACVLAIQLLLVDDVLAAGKPGVQQNSL